MNVFLFDEGGPQFLGVMPEDFGFEDFHKLLGEPVHPRRAPRLAEEEPDYADHYYGA